MNVSDILYEKVEIKDLLERAAYFNIPFYKDFPEEELELILQIYCEPNGYRGYTRKQFNRKLEFYQMEDEPEELRKELDEHIAWHDRIRGIIRRIESNRKSLCNKVAKASLNSLEYDYLNLESDWYTIFSEGARRIAEGKTGADLYVPVDMTADKNIEIFDMEKRGILVFDKEPFYRSEDMTTHIHGVRLADDYGLRFSQIDTEEMQSRRVFIRATQTIFRFSINCYGGRVLEPILKMYANLREQDERIPELDKTKFSEMFPLIRSAGWLERGADIHTVGDLEVICSENDAKLGRRFLEVVRTGFDESNIKQFMGFNEGRLIIMLDRYQELTDVPYYIPSAEELISYEESNVMFIKPCYLNLLELMRAEYQDQLSFSQFSGSLFHMFDDADDEEDETYLKQRYSMDNVYLDAAEQMESAVANLVNGDPAEDIFDHFSNIYAGWKEEYIQEFHDTVRECVLETNCFYTKGHTIREFVQKFPQYSDDRHVTAIMEEKPVTRDRWTHEEDE